MQNYSVVLGRVAALTESARLSACPDQPAPASWWVLGGMGAKPEVGVAWKQDLELEFLA